MDTQVFIKFFTWIFHIICKIFSTPKQSKKSAKLPVTRPHSFSFEEISHIYIKHLDWNKISSKTKLQLYANYKQSTCGDNHTRKPKRFWSKKYQQWLAWKKLRGINPKDAQNTYVELYYSERTKQLSPQRKHILSSIINSPGREEVKKQGLFAQYFDKSFSGVFLDQLPQAMVDEYLATHVHKYQNVAKGKNLTDLTAEEIPRTICDSEFFETLSNTLYGRGIVSLSSIENNGLYTELFGIDLEADNYYVCDTTIIRGFEIQEEDGFWMSPSIVLLNEDKVIAIAAESLNHIETFPPPPFPNLIGNMHVLYPEDGLAWEMAKLHTFANLAAISTMGFHPIMHFILMDPIAISNILIKDCNKKSVFSRIITEHTYLQIQVNSNVLFSEQSVTNNSNMPYYPWNIRPTPEFGILNIFRLIAEGWEEHPIYRGESDLIEEVPTPLGGYGRLLCKSKQIVKEFVDAWFVYFIEDPNELKFAKEFLSELTIRLPEICFLNPILKDLSSWNDQEVMEFMKKIIIYVIYTPIEHSVDHRFLEKSFFLETCHQIMRLPIPFHDRSTNSIHIHNYIKNINKLTDRAKHIFCQYFSFHHYPSKTLDNLFFDDGGYWTCMIPEHPDLETLNIIQERYKEKLASLYAGKDAPMCWLNIGTSIQS